MRKQIVVFPGQKVVATDGNVHIVAYVNDNKVYAYKNGLAQPIIVCGDAWGGENDQTIGLAAQS